MGEGDYSHKLPLSNVQLRCHSLENLIPKYFHCSYLTAKQNFKRLLDMFVRQILNLCRLVKNSTNLGLDGPDYVVSAVPFEIEIVQVTRSSDLNHMRHAQSLDMKHAFLHHRH